MVVRDNESKQDVEARFAAQALTVAGVAAAPVRHVPAAFLTAVAGLFPDLLETAGAQRGPVAL